MAGRIMQWVAAGISAACLATAAAQAQSALPDSDPNAEEPRLSTDLEGLDLGTPTPLPIFMPLADTDGVVRLYIRYDGSESAMITDLNGEPLVRLGQRRIKSTSYAYQAGTSDIRRLQDQIDLLRTELNQANAKIARLLPGRR